MRVQAKFIRELRPSTPTNQLNDIVIDKRLLRSIQQCKQLIQAMRQAEVEEIIRKNPCRK
jgi:hypothetical protein